MLVAPRVERVLGPPSGKLEAHREAEYLLRVRTHALEESLVAVPRSDPPQGDLAHVAAAAAGAGAAPPSSASGSRIVIVVPCPARLSTRIEPPCFSTIP